MAKQDDWKRITLRIPPDLYDRVAGAAGAASVNAEIVRRLEESFNSLPDPHDFEDLSDGDMGVYLDKETLVDMIGFLKMRADKRAAKRTGGLVDKKPND